MYCYHFITLLKHKVQLAVHKNKYFYFLPLSTFLYIFYIFTWGQKLNQFLNFDQSIFNTSICTST